jgi:hypothetical protein
MRGLRFAMAVALACLAGASARAQIPLSARLSSEKLADIQPGEYQAGDSVKFALDSGDGYYLLRFDGNAEVFVLYSDYTSLGGRVLKYDSGETALQVTGWGGMTLYTDAHPGGLPAVRLGDDEPPALQPVSLSDMQNATGDESEHLAYMRRINLTFDADWKALEDNDGLRASCFDALENIARGIDRFAASAPARKALSARFNRVLIAVGDKPLIQTKDKTLIATFNPDKGYRGRASSRAIARALEQLMHVK